MPGPNISSRKLYTAYGVDSIVVIHRRRRNNFLIAAEQSENKLIKDVIGGLKKITAWCCNEELYGKLTHRTFIVLMLFSFAMYDAFYHPLCFLSYFYRR